jgi:hypothetical protein
LADAEEATITEVMCENYTTPHRLFTNEDFITLTVDYWLMWYSDHEKPPLSNCSPGFTPAFKNPDRFSWHRKHFTRRSAAQSRWRVWLSSLLETNANDCILNCDETMWRLCPHDVLTWVKTKADDVSIYIDGDEKDGITVRATVSASEIK